MEVQVDAKVGRGVGAQTDAFVQLPPETPYVPRKSGVDACTQMDPHDGLFDFDYEVEPILDVMVGKILEQSIIELEQEMEMRALADKKVTDVALDCRATPTHNTHTHSHATRRRDTLHAACSEGCDAVRWRHVVSSWSGRCGCARVCSQLCQKSLHASKAAELDGMKKQEAVELDRARERRRLMDQRREFLARQRQAVQKAAAAQLGAQLARSMVEDALGFCEDKGDFRDPVRDAIEASFMPSLYDRVKVSLSHLAVAHTLIEGTCVFWVVTLLVDVWSSPVVTPS